MNEQRAKKRHRVGKQPMVRSQKRSIKKVEATKEINAEKMAFLKYLGHFDEEEDAPAKKLN